MFETASMSSGRRIVHPHSHTHSLSHSHTHSLSHPHHIPHHLLLQTSPSHNVTKQSCQKHSSIKAPIILPNNPFRECNLALLKSSSTPAQVTPSTIPHFPANTAPTTMDTLLTLSPTPLGDYSFMSSNCGGGATGGATSGVGGGATGGVGGDHCRMEYPTAERITTSADIGLSKQLVGVRQTPVRPVEPADPLAMLNLSHKRIMDCHFYYAKVTSAEAQRMLDDEAVGTFLLRDSGDSRYHYALSIQTVRGSTSVRISYKGGCFRLDCSLNGEKRIPSFPCVLSLISYYTSGSRDVPWALRETDSKRNTPILLRYPLLKKIV